MSRASSRTLDIARYLGIPYRLGGSDREGADCWGLVPIVYAEELGIDVPLYNQRLQGFRVPPRGFVQRQVEIAVQEGWDCIDKQGACCFDVVLFRNLRPFDHVGIVLEDVNLVLTTVDTPEGSFVQDWGPGTFWYERICGVYRYVRA